MDNPRACSSCSCALHDAYLQRDIAKSSSIQKHLHKLRRWCNVCTDGITIRSFHLKGEREGGGAENLVFLL